MHISTLVAALALSSAAAAQGLSCTSVFAGAGCGGTLSVSFSPQGGGGNQRIDVQATGLQPNVHGIMVWGVDQANIPLGNGCTLLTDFVWGHTILTSAAGEFDWSRTWPASVVGHYYIQIGSFTFDATNQFVVVGTNAQLATCQ